MSPGLAALLPLLLAVPLLAAALAAAVPWPRVRAGLALGVPAASTVAGGALLASVRRDGHPVVAQVGDFVPGVAIPFVADAASALMLTVIGLVTTLSLWFCARTGEFRARFFPALALAVLAGANGALLTGDAFNLFVCVEVMLMPSYALLAMAGGWRRLAAGRLFVVVNLVTSTLLLAAVGLLYGAAGTVSMAELPPLVAADARVAAAAGLVLLALAIKAGVAPVHGWLTRAYPATSPGVMALFAGVHTKVALVVILRLWAQLFGGPAAAHAAWGWPLLGLALLTVAWGAVGSLSPVAAREAIAWQMVSGIGVVLAALAVVSGRGDDALRVGVAAALAYLVHHMLVVGGLITAYGAVENTYGTGRFDRLDGLWERERATGVLVALGIAAIVGFPPTLGLPAKLDVVAAASGSGAAGWVTVAVVLGASLVGLVALVRLWRETMWGRPMTRYRPECDVRGRAEWEPLPDDVRIPRRDLAPAAVFAALSVAGFVGYGLLAPLLDDAAAALTDRAGYAAAVLHPEGHR